MHVTALEVALVGALAALASAVGAPLTVRIAGRIERQKEFRGRRIEAADDFMRPLSVARDAFVELHASTSAWDKYQAQTSDETLLANARTRFEDDLRKHSKAATVALADAHLHSSRMALVFPKASGVNDAAGDVLNAYMSAVKRLHEVLTTDKDFADAEARAEMAKRVREADAAFLAKAAEAIQKR